MMGVLLVLAASALAAAQPYRRLVLTPQSYLDCDAKATRQTRDPAVIFPLSLSYGQRWIFTNDGYLFNAYSGYVLEARLNRAGRPIRGRGLYLNKQKDGALNQQWKVDDKKRIVSKADESVAISPKSYMVNKTYNPLVLYTANDRPTQQWNIVSVVSQQFGNCPDLQGQGCHGQEEREDGDGFDDADYDLESVLSL
ncbi:hypothetical protein NP233_g7643 [Leucocoprinus birnbaumii]|uniref:Ricin B lectin domain-containing protein n=1 Tax=Leucocoprinus birnbaumii TaxID=56174 RepID=A0AAD5YPS1_9AGAR|nr:hypothetical protein NP233_g7643 [Leucocoprinus birnbaumii]